MSQVGVYHPRADWTTYDARGGNNPHNPPRQWAEKPVKHVKFHFVGVDGPLGMPAKPAAVMRSLQQYGWDRDGAGIEYNEVTFADGSTWEGFGDWTGAHISAKYPGTNTVWSRYAYGICWYGGTKDVPGDDAVEGLAFATVRAIQRGIVHPDAELGWHGQVAATPCAGPLIARVPDIAAEVRRLLAPPPAPTPEVPVPEAQPDVVQVAEPYEGFPAGAVFLCAPDFSSHRWVKDPDEFWQLQTSFARKGWAFPNPVPPIPAAWMKQYGVLEGPRYSG